MARHAVRVTDIIRPSLQRIREYCTSAVTAPRTDGSSSNRTTDLPGLVGPAALAAAIAATTREMLDCVVLNSCFTGQNADSFRGVTRGVAGSVREIEDDCALAFTRGFYTGLSAGQTAHQAYQTGTAQMKLQRCDTSGLHFVSFPDGD